MTAIVLIILRDPDVGVGAEIDMTMIEKEVTTEDDLMIDTAR